MPHNGWGPSGRHLLRPRRPERALAIAVLGAVLFLEPFLGIFDRGGQVTVWGVPLLYAYLFAAWSLVVVLTAVVMESRAEHAPHGSEEDLSGSGGSPANAGPVEHPAYPKPK